MSRKNLARPGLKRALVYIYLFQNSHKYKIFTTTAHNAMQWSALNCRVHYPPSIRFSLVFQILGTILMASVCSFKDANMSSYSTLVFSPRASQLLMRTSQLRRWLWSSSSALHSWHKWSWCMFLKLFFISVICHSDGPIPHGPSAFLAEIGPDSFLK